MSDRILVAVDIGEADIAPPALAAAAELAKTSGGQIRLLYVRSPIPVTHMDFVPQEYFVGQEKYAAEKLAQLMAATPIDAARISATSRFGAAYAGVLEEAKEWNADLIVVSAHQPTMATYLLGSNATKIVRHAHCSVLIVRAGKKASLFD